MSENDQGLVDILLEQFTLRAVHAGESVDEPTSVT